MANENLSLEIGDRLQLQYVGGGNDIRHYVKVIGYAADKSVLVTAPKVDGKVYTVNEGQQVIVRIMMGNDVVGFTASVLCICSRPYPYLHLSYPHDMQTITVRKALRVPVNMIAAMRLFHEDGRINMAMNPKAVTVLDLSTTGALLFTEEGLGEVGDVISLTMRLDVAGEQEDIMIPSLIRNVRSPESSQQQDKLHFGVEFKIGDRKESVLLHAFVFEQIAQGNAS